MTRVHQGRKNSENRMAMEPTHEIKVPCPFKNSVIERRDWSAASEFDGADKCHYSGSRTAGALGSGSNMKGKIG